MCLNDDFWAQIGQMIAVGMISAIVGLLPSLVISCLHQRDFIECEGEDDPVWKSTLRKWRMRDRVIWLLGGLFCAFSIFFTLLFLANVTENDAMSWLVAMVTSTLQTTILIPMILTCMLILFSAASSCTSLVDETLTDFFNEA